MFPVGTLADLHQAFDQVLQWQGDLAVHAREWIEGHGYVALFLLLFASGAGLPLPEDIPLVVAGICIARQTMTWWVAGPLAWLAMMMGDTFLYVLGYLLGYKVVHLPMIGRHFTETRLKRCEQWFARWGVWAVGIGRMIAGIRSAMVVAAGTLRFSYLKMLFADGIAAIISGGAFMYLGYWGGMHARPLKPLIEKYRIWFSLTALVAAILLIPVLRWRARKRAARLAALGIKPELEEVAPSSKPI